MEKNSKATRERLAKSLNDLVVDKREEIERIKQMLERAAKEAADAKKKASDSEPTR